MHFSKSHFIVRSSFNAWYSAPLWFFPSIYPGVKWQLIFWSCWKKSVLCKSDISMHFTLMGVFINSFNNYSCKVQTNKKWAFIHFRNDSLHLFIHDDYYFIEFFDQIPFRSDAVIWKVPKQINDKNERYKVLLGKL